MEAAWRAQLIIIVPLRIVRAHRFGQGRLRKDRRTKTLVKGDSRKNWEFPLAFLLLSFRKVDFVKTTSGLNSGNS